MKFKTVYIIVLAMLAILAGCATQRATINTYVAPGFQGGNIKKIAVFPIRNTRLAPTEAQQINKKMTAAIYSKYPGIKILSSAKVIRALNRLELTRDWATFLDNYITSGVPDAGILRNIGQTLKVDTIIQGEIVKVSQMEAEHGRKPATTRVTISFSMFDIDSGKLTWQSSSEGKKENLYEATAPPVIEAVDLALDKIIASLPPL